MGLGCARRAAGAPLLFGHGSIVSCPRCVPLRRRAPLRAPTLANRRPPPGGFRQSESGEGRGQGAGERARRSRVREVGKEGGGRRGRSSPGSRHFPEGRGGRRAPLAWLLKGQRPGEWGPRRGGRPGVRHSERAALVGVGVAGPELPPSTVLLLPGYWLPAGRCDLPRALVCSSFRVQSRVPSALFPLRSASPPCSLQISVLIWKQNLEIPCRIVARRAAGASLAGQSHGEFAWDLRQ